MSLDHNSSTDTSEPSRAKTPQLEFVSAVIPCFNEERFILKALERLVDQYDKKHYEVIVVDGLSDDGTRRVIEEFKKSRPDLSLTLVDNPVRNIPTALNLGVSIARGSIIARMDAHASPTEGYIRRCVEVLQSGEAAVVGMPCQVRPGANSLTARAIAIAVSHPFGIGDAKYRLGQDGPLQEPVDTVAFACFRKSLWEELGGFNEKLLTNEDYEFNYRVRLAGKQVLLDRSGHCDYFARTTFKGLAAQYFRYGKWKAIMIKGQPWSIRPRHLVAPIFVLSICVLALLGLIWSAYWYLLGMEITLYLMLGLNFGRTSNRDNTASIGTALIMPFIFLTIHLMWGTSFFVGLTTLRRNS